MARESVPAEELNPVSGSREVPAEPASAGAVFSTLNTHWFVRPDPDERLWRYMDLSKYVSMLTTATLWFARADTLGDPYEGSMSQANVQLRPSFYKGAIPGEVLAQMSVIRRKLVRYHYLSCWHASDAESMAMWRLYMKDHGIAVITSAAHMREALQGSDEIFLSRVNYVDYENYWIDEGNTFSPYFHKRRSFEHEREVRAVIARHPEAQQQEQPPDFDMPSAPGIPVPADIDVLVSEVRVAPQAPKWFRDAVADLSASYGLTCEVMQSSLDGPAVY